MADFNSNFNDIQKQITVADLTDEQIQELVATLQTRRSARPELTKEERVFFQCCRERRSYANNNLNFTQGFYMYHFLEVITWLIGVILLRKKPKEYVIEIGLSVVIAFIYQLVMPHWG